MTLPPPSLLAPSRETRESHTFITCHPPVANGRAGNSKSKEPFLPTGPLHSDTHLPLNSPFTGLGGREQRNKWPVSISVSSCCPLFSAHCHFSHKLSVNARGFLSTILYCNIVNSLGTILALHVVLWVAKMTTVLHYMPALCKTALQFLPSRAGVYSSSPESGLAYDLLWPIEPGRCDPVSFQALASRSQVY